MLTDDEIFLAIDAVPITKDYVVAVGRAIAAKVLEKLRPAEPLAVIGALERAAQMREEQAMQLAQANDYGAVYPEGDAKSLRDALDVFTRIGAGPSGVKVVPPSPAMDPQRLRELEKERGQREHADFHAWWDANQVDPLHTMVVQNAAHAAWQERARRAAAGVGGTDGTR